MKRLVLGWGALGLLVATLVGLGATPAGALPAPQSRCASTTTSIASDTGFQPLSDLALTISNGDVARRALVHLSADIGVDDQAEVRIAYAIDGGAPQERTFGPANFANHQQFAETRSTIAVIPLPAGTHTVTPYWRVSGVSGKQAVVYARCASIEARTS